MYIEFPKTEFIGARYPQNTGRNGEVKLPQFSKEYTYRVLPGMEELKLGDLVVVSSQNGFGVVVVTSLNKTLPGGFEPDEVACVVGKVDYDAYKANLDRLANKKSLMQELMRRKEELDKKLQLEIYADRDPEFKKLLDAYNSL